MVEFGISTRQKYWIRQEQVTISEKRKECRSGRKRKELGLGRRLLLGLVYGGRYQKYLLLLNHLDKISSPPTLCRFLNPTESWAKWSLPS